MMTYSLGLDYEIQILENVHKKFTILNECCTRINEDKSENIYLDVNECELPRACAFISFKHSINVVYLSEIWTGNS